jgi:hypothetical protein
MTKKTAPNCRKYTKLDLVNMTQDEFDCFYICLRSKSFSLLGMFWKKKISYYEDLFTGDLIFEWE